MARKEGYNLRGKKRSPLENFVIAIAVVSLIGSIFFLSGNITGNAVGGLNQASLNWIGILLLVMGLVEVFFILKKNKNFH